MHPNLTLPKPRTRLQMLAYYLVLGNDPSHAARLAGYAPSTIKAQAARLVKGKKLQHLQKVYAQRLGLLSEDTLAQGMQALRTQMNSSNPRTALAAIRTFVRLAREQVTDPFLDLPEKADINQQKWA